MNIRLEKIRGNNAPKRKSILKNKISVGKLDLVFIQETKCKMYNMYKFTKMIWGGCDCSTRGLRGFSRVMEIMWDPINMDLENQLTTY